MLFPRSLSDSEFPQVSRTLLSILANLNNAVVSIVSTPPVISKASSPLVTVPRAPITIGIIVTFMFHNFFDSLAKVEVLIPLFTFFQFHTVVWQDIIIIIIIIIYSLEFYTSGLADGLSLGFEWQQVSSSLQDFSQYSGCSQ